MMRLFLFTFSLILCASLSNAQEICSNGIDDDGDGFIDCYDKECSLNSVCSGFFILQDGVCNVQQDSLPPLQMRLKYKSDPYQTNHVSVIRAGDINGDGLPELITPFTAATTGPGAQVTAVTASRINVFNASPATTTLKLSQSINVPINGLEAVSYEDMAIADINGDGCAEIFAVTKDASINSNYKVVAYDCNGNSIWASPISFTTYPGLMGLADFDHDGLVELYSRTQVFDAQTGKLLGSNNIDNDNTGINAGVNKGWTMNNGGPIAVDIDSNNPGLELVAGCRIYGVDINRGTMTAAVTLLKSRPEYATRTGLSKSNSTSVADFNQDGYLDVLAVGSDGAYDDNTTIFYWDVQNNILKKYQDKSHSSAGWTNGAGRINIADIDGDTLMNAVYVSGEYLYALKETAIGTGLDTLWRREVNDLTSGFTGLTTFDFDMDGKSEIIYRDESYLQVFTTETTNGVTRVIQNTPIRCSSRTYNESPIVVDMDGDGAAEVCITCSTINSVDGKNLSLFDQAELRVYESANEPWRPTRKVWNQDGYFVTNVNDDLTIPRVQQLHHLVYAKNAPCRNGGSNRPFNSFLAQAPYLNLLGCPSLVAPNLSIVPFSLNNSIHYTSFTCLNDSIDVTFKYTNLGDLAFTGNLKISFYNDDPERPTVLATRLNTKTIFVSDLIRGDTIATTAKVRNPGNSFDLYMVINDDGTTLPLDISAQSDHIIECDYNNVTRIHIMPTPILVTPKLVHNDLKCTGAQITPDNGSVNASISIGSTADSTNFNFYWSNGLTALPVSSSDYVGSNYTSLSAGAYTVYALHKTLSCSSDTATLVVSEINSQVDARIIIEKEFNDPHNPNAEIRVVVNDADSDGVGDSENDFIYAWFANESVAGDTIGTSYSLTGLSVGTYSVIVSDKATGCYDSANTTIQFSSCPLFPAPNLSFVSVSSTRSIDYAPFTCLNDSIQIAVKYTNLGYKVLTDALKISFYDGDPTQSVKLATHLDTQSISVFGLSPGDTLTSIANIKNPGHVFNLYVVINDDGTTYPLDISIQPDHIIECDYGFDNVIHAYIIPTPILVTTELLHDNLKCLTVPGIPEIPDNGVISAYVYIGNAIDSTNFNFYWSNGVTASSTDYIGQIYTGLESGVYSVYAVHKTESCTSDTVTVVVGEVSSRIDARTILEKEFVDPKNPDGELRVIVNDEDHDGIGDPENNFTYAWFGGQDVLTGDTLGTSSILTGLDAGIYSVLVADKVTGCYDSAYCNVQLKEIILGLDEQAVITGISVYPNPGTDEFLIVIDNGYVGDVKIQLQSILGNDAIGTFTHHKGTETLKVPVNASRLKSGVYLVNISLGAHTLREKWVKY